MDICHGTAHGAPRKPVSHLKPGDLVLGTGTTAHGGALAIVRLYEVTSTDNTYGHVYVWSNGRLLISTRRAWATAAVAA